MASMSRRICPACWSRWRTLTSILMLVVARQFGDRDDLRILFVGAGAQKAALGATLAFADLVHCLAINWLESADIPEFWVA